MATTIFSAAILGLDCQPIEVEADLVPSLPRFFIVGLPDAAVQESKQRIRSAVKNSRLAWPRGQLNVNLAPADLKKQGPAYDLPIALSLLGASKVLNLEKIPPAVYVGELALDGHLRPIPGILPIAIMARDSGIKKIFLPGANAAEASLINNIEIFPLDSLGQAVNHLVGKELISPYREKTSFKSSNIQKSQFDMAFIRGQEHVKRALEIAAAGAHNILMQGPPGSGKTLLARTVPTILPDLTLDESLEITKIYSVAGLLSPGQPLIAVRPFRSPHHTASGISLVGGGTWPRPGEISLAHHGVLFLDEFPEFPRAVLDNLRQPLEDGIIHIARAAGTLSFPAKFILLASMNPCLCGYFSDPDRQCTCSAAQIAHYTSRISGPLIDRIDISIEVPRVDIDKLSTDDLSESSKNVRARVNAARQKQFDRFNHEKIITNSEMSSERTRQICRLDIQSQTLLKNAIDRLRLSARSYYRILKLARTIADLDNDSQIKEEHLAEALQYRPKVGV